MSTRPELMNVIAKQEWMKPVEESLQDALHRTYSSAGEAGIRVKNFLNGTWLGHPLHVILTDIPLGAWTSAIIFDVVSANSNSDSMDSAADRCIAIGLGGAITAVLTGATDWQDVDPPARRVGLLHGLLNIAAAGLMATSLFARRSENRAAGRWLGFLGFLVAAAAADLGGELVYEHRIGVDHSEKKDLPLQFRRVIAARDLEDGKPVKAYIDDTPVVIVKTGSEIFALADTCSHLGGPLSEGKVEVGSIQCPWHGSTFNLRDGSVVNGPAVHHQPCLEVRVSEGQVELRRRLA